MTHVISVVNMKGGVGKTTTTVMLGEFLAGEFGERVLLIDMDPQSSLSITMLGPEQYRLINEAGRTLSSLIEDAIHPDAEPRFNMSRTIAHNASTVKKLSGVDLLPSSLDAIPQQRHLSQMYLAKRTRQKAWEILRDGVEPILDDYTYVLIDCPPSVDLMTMNALVASHAYVIPTLPDVLSTYGVKPLRDEVRKFSEESELPSFLAIGTIVTRYRRSAASDGQVTMMQNMPDRYPRLIGPWVPDTDKISSSAAFRQYPSLKNKYGYRNYKTLWELTANFKQRVEERA